MYKVPLHESYSAFGTLYITVRRSSASFVSFIFSLSTTLYALIELFAFPRPFNEQLSQTPESCELWSFRCQSLWCLGSLPSSRSQSFWTYITPFLDCFKLTTRPNFGRTSLDASTNAWIGSSPRDSYRYAPHSKRTLWNTLLTLF